MAGDWMKIELELPDKPEVHYIANALNLNPDQVVGLLLRVWVWFNKHTTDGNAHGVTFALCDRITNVTGFGEAMMLAGWLEQQDKTLHMPKFDRHTSESSKKRALSASRQSKYRNANSNAGSVTEASQREEKNINNNNSSAPKKRNAGSVTEALFPVDVPAQVKSDFLALRKAKKSPLSQTALDGIAREAEKAGISLAVALAMCCERGWQGFKAEWVAGKSVPVGETPEEFARRMTA